jgi:hypothetical protein
MGILVNLQIVIILTMLILLFLERRGWCWPTSHMWLLYYATLFVARIAVNYANRLPRLAFPEYYKISLACQSFREYIDVSVYFAASQNSSSWKGVGIGVCTWVGCFIASLLVVYILPRLADKQTPFASLFTCLLCNQITN